MTTASWQEGEEQGYDALFLQRSDITWPVKTYEQKRQPGACSSCLCRVREGSDRRGDCFQDLNPRPHGHKATALPLRQGSPSTDMNNNDKKKNLNRGL
jgi:hypothetical protein